MPENLMTPPELSQYLQRPIKLLSQWRYRGIGPRYLKLEGGHIRYDPADVAIWLREQAVPTGVA